jgi:hypothetical protein
LIRQAEAGAESVTVCRCSLKGHVVPVEPQSAGTATSGPVYKEVPATASKYWAYVFTKQGFARAAAAPAEIFVRLRGDFVIDGKKRAIDAEFTRADLPTGDRPHGSKHGIQGGLFESWFWIGSGR